jgi:hypothetical protein
LTWVAFARDAGRNLRAAAALPGPSGRIVGTFTARRVTFLSSCVLRSDDTRADWAEVASVDHTDARKDAGHAHPVGGHRACEEEVYRQHLLPIGRETVFTGSLAGSSFARIVARWAERPDGATRASTREGCLCEPRRRPRWRGASCRIQPGASRRTSGAELLTEPLETLDPSAASVPWDPPPTTRCHCAVPWT